MEREVNRRVIMSFWYMFLITMHIQAHFFPYRYCKAEYVEDSEGQAAADPDVDSNSGLG
jgi:hypothetical protein